MGQQTEGHSPKRELQSQAKPSQQKTPGDNTKGLKSFGLKAAGP
jgi:hypothetical protein